MSIYGNTPILIYSIAVAFVFGTCMGSFLNCVAWRSVHGESFLRGRSHCTACRNVLEARDLIPVLSWMFLKGRCRYCGEKVPVRYPLTELAFGIITVLCLLRFDLTVMCLRNYLFLCVLFVLTLTDIDDMIIPDGCHVAAVIIWAAAEFIRFEGWSTVITHVAAGLVFGGGMLAISLILDRIMGRDTLGGGDIKLLAVTGLYLGFIGAMFALVLACICGLLFNIIVNKSSEKGSAFPFGPWIAAAAAIMLLYGDPLVNWYSGLLG